MPHTLRIFTPETWRSRGRPAPCLFLLLSHHRRNDQAELEPKPELETADSSSLHVWRTWPTARSTHTRGLGDSSTLATTFFWQWGYRSSGTRVTVPCSWKVEVGIPDLRVKNFQQKNNRPPARKNLSHVSRSRDLFLFGLRSLLSRTWAASHWQQETVSAFAGLHSAMEALPQAHELAHRRNIIAYLNSVHLWVQQCA